MALQTSYSPITLEAARLLGRRIQLARKERRWTLGELADRVGVTPVTMRKVERGDPTVKLGIAFEAATIAGVALFSPDRGQRSAALERVESHLSLLPKHTHKPRMVDDDF